MLQFNRYLCRCGSVVQCDPYLCRCGGALALVIGAVGVCRAAGEFGRESRTDERGRRTVDCGWAGYLVWGVRAHSVRRCRAIELELSQGRAPAGLCVLQIALLDARAAGGALCMDVSDDLSTVWRALYGTCMKNHVGAQVAAGFSNSTVRVWRLDGFGVDGPVQHGGSYGSSCAIRWRLTHAASR